MSRDPDKNREHQRRYRERNRETKRASGRAYAARNRSKVAAYAKSRREPRLEYVNALKMETGCEAILPDGSVCGYRIHPEGLDFDHVDPSTKSFTVSTQLSSLPWPEVLAEIAKCRVLCACCHRHRSKVDRYIGPRAISLPDDYQLDLFGEQAS